MSLQLSPSAELGFNRPFTQVVNRTFILTNQNAQPVAFKVKTTSPKLYAARPNSGIIEPGSSANVQVSLQAMQEDPPLSFKCKDRFLVQSMILTPDRQSKSIQDMWVFDDDDEDVPQIYQQKLKVVYLPPVSQPFEEDDFDQTRFIAEEEITREEGNTPVPIPPTPPAPVHSSISSLKPQHEGDGGRDPSPGLDYTSAEEGMRRETAKPLGDKSPRQPHVADNTAFTELNQRYAEAKIEIDRLQGWLASVTPADAANVQKRNSIISDDGTVIETVTIVAQRPRGVPLYLVILVALPIHSMMEAALNQIVRISGAPVMLRIWGGGSTGY
ncbi:phosphatidylinositol-binding protein scs2 [Ceratobasidium sp. 414]|nr:phosphatidylinositol-binding protein scs2 [Ceratobasidium sp. 414]